MSLEKQNFANYTPVSKRAVLYVRVSTDKQECENQKIALRDFARHKDLKIVWEYSDIISGKINTRPGFNKLFEDAHKHLFDIVIFWDLSRFSRSGTLYTLQKLKELQNLNIDWLSYQEPHINSAGQFKDILISLMATISKMEREQISERTKAGLKRLKLSGKTLGRPKGKKDKKKRLRSCWKNPYKGGV